MGKAECKVQMTFFDPQNANYELLYTEQFARSIIFTGNIESYECNMRPMSIRNKTLKSFDFSNFTRLQPTQSGQIISDLRD